MAKAETERGPGRPDPVASVSYWDEYAPWYMLWLEHTDYHRGIKAVLEGLARPGWRVLDIGGGSGVLAIPLMRSGCRVTVVEPSAAMRASLRTEMAKADVQEDRIIESPWEEVPPAEAAGFDLAVASNSLHLTRIGAARALERIVEARPARIVVASERDIPLPPGGNGAGAYVAAGSGAYEAENSFRYHSVEQALRHLELKDRHGQAHPTREEFLGSLAAEDGHWVHRRRTTVRWLRLDRVGA